LEARVFLNDIDVGSQMIRDGVAWYDTTVITGLSVGDQNIYAQCEQAARSEKRGLWADQNPVSPWEFRKAEAAKLAAATAPAASLKSKSRTGTANVKNLYYSGSGADKRIGFTVPAAPWALTLPAADFVFDQEKVKPDGRYGYFY